MKKQTMYLGDEPEAEALGVFAPKINRGPGCHFCDCGGKWESWRPLCGAESAEVVTHEPELVGCGLCRVLLDGELENGNVRVDGIKVHLLERK